VPFVLPDIIASDEVSGSYLDLDMMDIVNGSRMRPRTEYGNALRCLCPLLRQTKYRCYRAHRDVHQPPIFAPISLQAMPVAWNRLRLQALSLGMDVNPWAPWVFENKNSFLRVDDTFGFHKADLVPDNPSDWIYFDPQMIFHFAVNFYCIFNIEGFGEVLRRTFPENPVFFGHGTMQEKFTKKFAKIKLPWIADEHWKNNENMKQKTELKENWSLSVFEETITVLKDGGNEAMKLGLYHRAAQRYDKGIQYCAVALMEHPMAIPNHPEVYSVGLVYLYRNRSLPTSFFGTKIEGYQSMVIKDGTSPYIYWSSVLQTLIALRLNLSLLLLKPEFRSPLRASEQALEVLKLLKPFVTNPCLVVGEGSVLGKSDAQEFGKPEPISTFREAKPLEAKAYYRLGCAQFELHNYRDAVKGFRQSLECSQRAKCDRWGKALGTVKPNPQVLQRIEEAEAKLKETKAKGKPK
jgi:tetratricopeptide (TPR) repeat protein